MNNRQDKKTLHKQKQITQGWIRKLGHTKRVRELAKLGCDYWLWKMTVAFHREGY